MSTFGIERSILLSRVVRRPNREKKKGTRHPRSISCVEAHNSVGLQDIKGPDREVDRREPIRGQWCNRNRRRCLGVADDLVMFHSQRTPPPCRCRAATPANDLNRNDFDWTAVGKDILMSA